MIYNWFTICNEYFDHILSQKLYTTSTSENFSLRQQLTLKDDVSVVI